MKIRRRCFPHDLGRKSSPGGNVGGFRMRRDSHDIYNHAGDALDPAEIQAAVVEATRAHASGERAKEEHVVGYKYR